MHGSKLSTFVIDCRTDDLDGAARFWAEALGRRLLPPEPSSGRYRSLEASASEPLLMVQQVEHESRVHLDIESDDIPAEVARLEGLGARRVGEVRTWVVMEAPTGQRFCVVRPQRGPEALGVRRWPSAEALPALGDEARARTAALAAFAGRYHGTTRLWLDPAAPPEESLGELLVEPMLDGRWLRMVERGSAMGSPFAGELVLCVREEPLEIQGSWAHTFHTAGSLLAFRGAPRTDGVVAITTRYAAGGQEWSWRTELWPPTGEGFEMRCFNIDPEGTEYPAIETRWRR